MSNELPIIIEAALFFSRPIIERISKKVGKKIGKYIGKKTEKTIVKQGTKETIKKVEKTVIKEAGKAVKLPDATFTAKKLQHELKHSGDFGVTGNWNKATGEVYQKAIQNHIDTASDVYKSTYRGDDVYVYINKNTGVGAYTDLSGNYVGGWKFKKNEGE